jgi:hypothetical protein
MARVVARFGKLLGLERWTEPVPTFDEYLRMTGKGIKYQKGEEAAEDNSDTEETEDDDEVVNDEVDSDEEGVADKSDTEETEDDES